MPGTLTLRLDAPEKTRALGEAVGRLAGAGCYICLYGDLGAGKTTFVQGLAAGLGVTEAYITSPSFALVNEYAGRLTLYHIDLYRLSGPDDLADIGFSEYPGAGVAAVEWPERAGEYLPDERLDIFIEYDGAGRSIRLAAYGMAYEALLEAICRTS
ncbi:MAG: tRNA (adenosine(37)-N6)-threonylcarbamoyltransferase complex ATPase subunit type 1 TsaE [Nitrospirae bacterium]|nr:tRNA (adenosine(37)-N6)-threonylcarbamoyltransferase complex ATPase subunit type 1 TsaE [Nitrospirota bacterium]